MVFDCLHSRGRIDHAYHTNKYETAFNSRQAMSPFGYVVKFVVCGPFGCLSSSLVAEIFGVHLVSC